MSKGDFDSGWRLRICDLSVGCCHKDRLIEVVIKHIYWLHLESESLQDVERDSLRP